MADGASSDGSVVGLQIQVGKLEERVAGIDKNLGGQISGLSQQLTGALSKFESGYATIAALSALRDDVVAANKRIDGVWSTIGWTVKIVVGGVLMALMGLLFAKGGVPHP